MTRVKLSTLPPEILSNIFLFCKLITIADSWPGDLTWIRVTHVCRAWRDTALGYGDLWTTLWVPKPHLVDVMLERSKGRPLSVHCYGHLHPTTFGALGHVLSLTSRLRAVDINVTIYSRQDWFVSSIRCMRGTAPHLEQLKLTCAATVVPWTIEYVPLEFELQAPRLNTLHLTNTQMKWSTLPLGEQLVDLRLYRATGTTPSPITWGALSSHLARLPLLETLDLRRMLPQSQQDARRPTTLDQLRSISLIDPSMTIATFFHHVRAPAMDNVFLGAFGDAGLHQDHISRNIDRCFTNMKLSCHAGTNSTSSHWLNGDVEEITISDYCGDMASDLSPHKPIQLKLRFSGTSDTRKSNSAKTISLVGLTDATQKLAVSPQIMDSIIGHYKLSNLSRLVFTTGSWSAESDMVAFLSRTTFASSPRLHHVTLDGRTLTPFLTVLTKGTPSSDEPSVTPPYPALKELLLLGLDFGWRGGTILGDLVGALRSRPNDRRLEIVTFRKCRSFCSQDKLELSIPDLVVKWEEHACL